ncbi:hypothetical protein HW561_11810 [Rhodobacteraceae bacterium B1Z28]|uniref:Uncharacterized protein n=1 Tax=Ruegeria haliotis TaxID=2747601 RepID=A0ABX2PQR2_9RHOB|nr:hypothetical protein [Ruegeria haliotis]NVO56472.1 hypothetical protein [Ruegeria haliotis]
MNQGITFDHLIVFVDISDIQDEAIHYSERDDGSLAFSSVTPENQSPSHLLKQFLKTNLALSYSGYSSLRTFIRGGSVQKDVYNIHRLEWTYNDQSSHFGEMGVDGGILKSLQYMTDLYELLKERGIKLSVGVYPWPAQLKEMESNSANNRQSNIWQEFCTGKCEMFIDLFPDFSSMITTASTEDVYRDYYLQGDVHFNASGNAIMFTSLNSHYNSMD